MHPARTPRIEVRTAAHMRALGRSFAARLHPGTILLLEGPLGSGKTTFVQGLARGLGIARAIVSPTFALRKLYPCPAGRAVAALNHLDAYRMENARELRGLMEEALDDAHDAVWVIEWGGKLRRALPRRVQTLIFSHTASGRRLSGLPATLASPRANLPPRARRRPRRRGDLR